MPARGGEAVSSSSCSSGSRQMGLSYPAASLPPAAAAAAAAASRGLPGFASACVPPPLGRPSRLPACGSTCPPAATTACSYSRSASSSSSLLPPP